MITELLYYIFIFPLEQVLEVVLHNIQKIFVGFLKVGYRNFYHKRFQIIRLRGAISLMKIIES